MINVTLVTTWKRPCGIAEHSAMLIEAVQADADLVGQDIQITANQDWLDPKVFWTNAPCDIVHLNYQAALHSRWMVDNVEALQAQGKKVVITYHDTFAGTPEQPNTDRCRALAQVADAFIVHEPVADIPNAIYWRQGVPGPETSFHLRGSNSRPIVGTCGFDFPWKNYELLARSSYEAGWEVLFVGGNITKERQETLRACNPHIMFVEGFVHRKDVVVALAGCDATAFLYLNANTGTSGAIRMGMAARRPLLATHWQVCRQFRDLADTGHDTGISWLDDLSPPAVTEALARAGACQAHRLDHLAEQDSWARLGTKYAECYRRLVA